MRTNSSSLHGCFCLCFYIKKYDVCRCVWCFWMYPSERNGATSVTIARPASFSILHLGVKGNIYLGPSDNNGS
jgi:hypothetical protein